MTGNSPVIIEVAVNGHTTREVSPHVPYTPDEIAADAIACIDAGASVIHTHYRPLGRPGDPAADLVAPVPESAALHAEGLRPIRAARPIAVLYPTNITASTASGKFDHYGQLADEGLIDMAAIDPGSVNLAATDADGNPPMNGFLYVNSPADINYMIGVCRMHKIGPNFGIYEPGFLRTVIAYYRAGRLPPGSFPKFYFTRTGYSGVGYPLYSPPPIADALGVYCTMLSGCDLPWAVGEVGGDILDTPVARLALERGGHLRIGLENNPRGQPNVKQVEQAVAMCREVGRPIATPKQAREILGLPARS